MNKNNTIISIIIIVVAGVIGYLLFKYFPKQEEVQSPVQQLDTETQADTTTSIDENLNSIDTNTSTDADLKAIDDQLNNL
ncbi:MAG: hypothetical protein QG566_694 [Patescibacteria group bacterium]|jgi:Flp pilus assembly protein CpaB|nr:hypothetical protein [Patescibacteria group bacterium]